MINSIKNSPYPLWIFQEENRVLNQKKFNWLSKIVLNSSLQTQLKDYRATIPSSMYWRLTVFSGISFTAGLVRLSA